jgi:hypothetical protein
MTKTTERNLKAKAARKPKEEKKPKSVSPKEKLVEAEQAIHNLSNSISLKSRQSKQLEHEIQTAIEQRTGIIGYAQACRDMLGLANPPDPAHPFRPADVDEKPELGVIDESDDGSKEDKATE